MHQLKVKFLFTTQNNFSGAKMKDDFLIHIFCLVDDFCKEFEQAWKKYLLTSRPLTGDTRNKRSPNLSLSEIMTIVIYFHHSKFRTFKDYYNLFVTYGLKKYFPKLPSYSRFVYLMKRVVFPLFVFSQGLLGKCRGFSFVDSTILTVCHVRRISSNRVFHKVAKRGKTSTGWFFGFKLHLVINDRGEILAFMITAGNVDDRKPVPHLMKGLNGKCFGDKGYLSSKLFQELWEKGVQLITRLRKGMHNKLISLWDRLLLRKRGLIESVHNKLKNSCQIEHHRHRSRSNFLVNLLSGIIAYCQDPVKPSLRLQREDVLHIQRLAA
jgi:hypothetical protein